MLFTHIDYVDADFQNVRDGFLLVEGSRIAYLGKEKPRDYDGPCYDGRGKLAMPGFFNTHCHVPMTLIRGYGEGLPLDRWLFERMFPFEAKLDGEAVYWGALLGIAEMISSGIVSFNDMYFFLSDIARAVEESGIKANISQGLSSQDESQRLADNKGYKEGLELLDIIKGSDHDRIAFDVGLHAEYTSCEGFVRQVADYAREGGHRVQVHLSETEKEHKEGIERRGKTPAAFFKDCGLLDAPTTAAHCVAVDEADLEILREKRVTVAHNPSSNLKLGSGVAPVLEMQRRGIQVTIGTDGAASNNNLNGLEEVNLASILQKGVHRDPMAMGVETTLRMACRNGALSQGRKDCGALAEGNRADIVIYDMDKPHLQPVFDPAANVLYAAQASDVCLTMVDGKTLYKDGEFLTMDIERVKGRCREIKEKILREL